ncbi:putative non-heme bromoperoxidase BpoC [Clavibacter michiganensis subsp. michiganensis]|uniref:alpha/beta fold hydrolase n=1 Tax=Clavibacter michiganensis TaxID=28447 RepID=UPI000A397178|nr:alpha/beta hydrolase [Clavibacter michiganensis]MDO4099306.1 alpha/beta hydrolase [Clavibacter michiganensis]OUD88796.1 putative non-heme bromoperoxidase BpoC [Clavibacter michiganensis subsp. michiganensis]OUE05252.1 putative non-heme bromoperoxidase BpoC [Clavibacter michiganensis subsp. michiganensis]OUE13148.1 putative non-heme bromoperoxidase BpoC [Clavibacter michiganensis subsp. michiganensis]OUE26512.1 putative non-heme bromoperoxidase BpoC [Clavibacter michiganensis subsp. michigan
MPSLTVHNGTTLFYDTFGHHTGRPLVLIEGLTAQMIKWRPEFCQMLVDQGFFVIRFDNRDVGLSQKFEGQSYTLVDMAEDVAGLIEKLDIAPAHIAAQSMGGMIAQELAIHHPDMVASLTLFYTSASQQWLLPPAYDREILNDHATLTKEQAMEEFLAGERACRSEAYPQDQHWLRQLAEMSYDRDPVKSGNVRQAAAVLAAPDRVAAIAAITAPTTIITGDADLLIDHHAADELHQQISGSRLRKFPGMGHEITESLWPQFVEAIMETAYYNRGAFDNTSRFKLAE